jgi:hypothetical protein
MESQLIGLREQLLLSDPFGEPLTSLFERTIVTEIYMMKVMHLDQLLLPWRC